MNKIAALMRVVLKEMSRRKDFYLIFVLLVIIILYASFAQFGGERDFQRYFKEIGVSLVYIFSVIIVVIFAARQIPQETETRTIYSILAHPVSRTQFIMGKFFGVFFVSAASFTVFYIVFVLTIFIRKDFSAPPALLFEGYLLHILLLSFFTSLTIFLSLFLSAAANSMICLILYFGTNWFGAVLPGYILLPHPELFDIKDRIIHSTNIIPGWVIAFLVLYAFIYTTIFLILTCVVFRKRNL